ncbi:NADH-quinone oxidoreductase subunit C [Fervidicoccus fontis]|jgi:Ni,Fe-hydrogenase III large subunit/Ni,Fe-hydrogenase III component G|uniref:Component HyfG of membrane-bound [Ni,Fe]-hydrogenase n=1 Tax=Fervidicoccus fontis (strain DSM 19380 / JCM 18336 / VKM B-2539 / Kam940) TaxID=1163730 RepID=I0A2R7_FERFK|nr:NADH-quinone oxidoreductase subunit C [Fervidicoccus fontis]AFH43274.1 Component HyfG of membrane-bound [Ni,Fe]-hydrogenase [Fervidicoccus fontis Kam940]
MTEERISYYIKQLDSNFKSDIISIERTYPDKVFVGIRKDALLKICSYIFWELGGFLSTMSVSDMRKINGSFRLDYVFSIEEKEESSSPKPWIIVYTMIPGNNPRFQSVTPELPAANWYEREAKDLFGVIPEGHPDPRKLILPDDWPDGIYPLRKDMDYTIRPGEVKPAEYKWPKEEGITTYIAGPIHIMADEPGQFRIYLDGEIVVDLDYRFSYAHRGVEKLGEARLTYNQVPFLAERICGICGFVHSTSYVQAIEEAMKIDVPERAKYIRTIMLEIERATSHLLWLGLASHLAAFDWGFMQLWKVRERLMNLAEVLTGARKTYGINVVGGVRRDIIEERRKKSLEILKKTEVELKDIGETVLKTSTLLKRMEGIGVLPKDVARTLNVVGPVARGSGLYRDVRKDHPYAAYRELSFKIPLYTEGDILARFLVRYEETFESLSIIEQALDRLPNGPIFEEVKEVEAYRPAIGAVEAPRGEVVHFAIIGEDSKIYRWRVRAPTYSNWPSVPYMSRGYTLADVPLIVASIDPCYSCTERVEVVDVRTKRVEVVEYEEIIKRSKKGV